MENKLVQIIKNQRQVVCPNERFLFEGQPGGKWLGTSYFYRLLKDNASEIEKRFEGQVFFVCPRTIVLQTDLFKDFMDQNNLWEFAYQTNDDQKIKKKFLEAEFNRKQKEELSSIIKIFDKPLAIRSSSLNEDAERVSFAGIFYSIFLPNNLESIEERNAQLQDAIKLVYMSQYLEKAKEFYNRFNVLWGDERMAVIIQEVAGREHLIKDKRIYYPELSFVSFSYNDYATDMVEPSSGFYRIALGLGVGTVELEHNVSIAVNTGRPNPIIGLTCREDIIRNSPQYFYAIDLSKKNNIINEQYDFLLKLPVGFLEQTIIERHGTYFDEDFLPSTFKIPGR
ncbi:MAG: PEP/pyruvate-binding domain-containing protein, partial [Candidatus Anstonellaceae archaeon]